MSELEGAAVPAPSGGPRPQKGPKLIEGTVASVNVTTLPANGTLYFADGVTAVSAGQALTPAQAAGLVFRPAADFNGEWGHIPGARSIPLEDLSTRLDEIEPDASVR